MPVYTRTHMHACARARGGGGGGGGGGACCVSGSRDACDNSGMLHIVAR